MTLFPALSWLFFQTVSEKWPAVDLSIGGVHVTSSPPCWWTKTIDLSLAPFVRPPAFVRFTIVICVSRDWLKTTYIIKRKLHGGLKI